MKVKLTVFIPTLILSHQHQGCWEGYVRSYLMRITVFKPQEACTAGWELTRAVAFACFSSPVFADLRAPCLGAFVPWHTSVRRLAQAESRQGRPARSAQTYDRILCEQG